MIDEPALLDPPMEGALHEGRQLHLAIATPKGLHVTPTLYALGPGRLWFFAASATVKAKQIATGDRGGALVRAGARSVVVTGRLERLDLMAPNQLAGAARAVPGVPQAVLGYAARNAADLLGFALDTAAGRGGRGVPPRRILISLVPDRVALLDGDVLVEARGAWPGSAGDERRMRLGRPVASGSQTPPVPSVLAWAGPDGPLALPAHWSPETGRAAVPGDLMAISRAERTGPAALVLDEYGRPGPAGKQGCLLRGEGCFGSAHGGWRWLRIDPDRLTTWDGLHTETKDLP